jgi:fumarate hydratase class II
MGRVEIPGWAYWGAQTQRAVQNFGVSDKRIPPALIRALARIKRCAAEVNAGLGLLERSVADAICRAADEVLEGRWDEHFPVDVFQTGSGTSWNMNMNEVLANRANELLGASLGAREPVHPNDHVNRGQSSNDVIPSAIHIADTLAAVALAGEMRVLQEALASRAHEFRDIVKIGRTHLQDAVPVTLGQEFSGYASQIEKGIERLEGVLPRLQELALGGTAVGTGLGAHPDFGDEVIRKIAASTGMPFRPARNRFEAIACRDAQSELMGAVNTIAGSLTKIADDLRLLSSGPRAGLGEILLPPLQPGSSIMPGKANPVIPEMVIQVAAHLTGQCLTVTQAARSAPLELNMMLPLIAYETITALELAGKTCRVFAERCVRGIEADEARCAHWVEWSLALVTPLAARIGHDRAADLARRAFEEKKTVRQVLLEAGVLTEREIDEMLDPGRLAGGS